MSQRSNAESTSVSVSGQLASPPHAASVTSTLEQRNPGIINTVWEMTVFIHSFFARFSIPNENSDYYNVYYTCCRIFSLMCE